MAMAGAARSGRSDENLQQPGFPDPAYKQAHSSRENSYSEPAGSATSTPSTAGNPEPSVVSERGLVVSSRGSGPAVRSFEIDEEITLGRYILERVGFGIKELFKNSYTVARVDLRQPIRYDGPSAGQGRQQREQQKRRGTFVVQPHSSQAPTRSSAWNSRDMGIRASEAVRYSGNEEGSLLGTSRGWFDGIQGGGARLKLMQLWNFIDTETTKAKLPWNLNLGFGANVMMDRGEVQPKLRIRAKHVALHFLPEPSLELFGRWPLGNTNIGIHVRYRVPVTSLDRFWESPSSRLMINLFHQSGTGLHLTPTGVELEDQAVPIGQFGTMRVAAAVDFPRQFPLQEGEQPFRIRVTWLGLKSRVL